MEKMKPVTTGLNAEWWPQPHARGVPLHRVRRARGRASTASPVATDSLRSLGHAHGSDGFKNMLAWLGDPSQGSEAPGKILEARTGGKSRPPKTR